MAQIASINAAVCTANGSLYQYALVMDDVYSATAVQLYTVGGFGAGAIMYTDYAMTTPLTGQNYITINQSTPLHTISSTTGIVGCIAVEC